MNRTVYAFLKVPVDEEGKPIQRLIKHPGNPIFRNGFKCVLDIKYIWNYVSNAEIWVCQTRDELSTDNGEIYYAKTLKIISKAKESKWYEKVCKEIFEDRNKFYV